MIVYGLQVFLNSLVINWLPLNLATFFATSGLQIKSLSIVLVLNVVSGSISLLLSRTQAVSRWSRLMPILALAGAAALYFVGESSGVGSLLWCLLFTVFMASSKLHNSSLFASVGTLAEQTGRPVASVNRRFYFAMALAFLSISLLLQFTVPLGVGFIGASLVGLQLVNVALNRCFTKPQSATPAATASSPQAGGSYPEVWATLAALGVLYLSICELFSLTELPILSLKQQISDAFVGQLYAATLLGNIVAIQVLSRWLSAQTVRITLGVNLLVTYAVVAAFAGPAATRFDYTVLGLIFGVGNGLHGVLIGLLIQGVDNFATRRTMYLVNSVMSSVFSLAAAVSVNFISLEAVIAALPVICLSLAVLALIFIAASASRLRKTAAAMTVLALAGLGPWARAADIKTGTALISHIPKTISPLSIDSVDVGLIANQIYQKLFVFNAKNEISPSLAESLSWCADQTCLKVKLKKSIKFSNGDEFVAADVKIAFEQVAKSQKDAISWAMGNLSGFHEFTAGRAKSLEGVQVKGPYDVEFKFAKKTPLFSQFLATPYFFIGKTDKQGNWIGTGKYVVSELSAKRIVLSPKSEGLNRWVLTEDRNDPNLDLSFIMSSFPNTFEKRPYPLLQTTVALFNQKTAVKMGPGQRCLIGEKLDLAFQSIREKWNPVVFGIPFNREVTRLGSHLEITPKKGRPISIRITYADAYTGFNESERNRIQSKLVEYGIVVQFEKVDKKTFFKRARSGDFEILLLDFIPDYLSLDALFYPMLVSGQQYNWIGYSNKKVDAALEKARYEADKDSEGRYYSEAIDILRAECPVAFLGFIRGEYWAKPNVTVPAFSSLGFHNLSLSEVVIR